MNRFEFIFLLAICFPMQMLCSSDKPVDWDFKSIFASEVETIPQLLHLIAAFDADTAMVVSDLDYYNKIYPAAVKLGVDSSSCKFAFLKANYLYDLGSLDLAIEAIDNAYAHLEFGGLKRNLAMVCNQRGILYNDKGEYEKAIDSYFESIDLYQASIPDNVTIPLGNLSEVYEILGDLKNAIKYTKMAIPYSRALKGPDYYYNYGWDSYRLSKWYDQMEKRDSAQKYLQESLAMIAQLDGDDEISYKELIFLVHSNAVRFHLIRSNPVEAKKHLLKAKESVDRRVGGGFRLIEGEYHLAINNKSSLFQLIESDNLSFDYYPDQECFLQLKINAYKKYGLLEKALLAHEELDELVKKKFYSDKERYQNYTTAKFDALKKQEEIDALKNESQVAALELQKQKAFTTAGIVLLLLFLLGISFLFYRYRQKSKYSELLQCKVDKKTADLNALLSDLAIKNQELNRFNHIISNDLKEPIRSILSFSELLKSKLRFDKDLESYTHFISNSGQQLQKLIQDIEHYQNLETSSYPVEKVNLSVLVEKTKLSLEHLIKDRQAVIHHSDLPIIYNSASAVFVIVQHLISNGIRYNNHTTPSITITSKELASEVLISFSDNGIGIPQEHYTSVFEKFNRLHSKNKYSGSGIGLATSLKLARYLGGDLRIEKSELDVGSTFLLVLKKGSAQDTSTVSETRLAESL